MLTSWASAKRHPVGNWHDSCRKKRLPRLLHASGGDDLEALLVPQTRKGMAHSIDAAWLLKVSKSGVCHAAVALREGGFLTMDEDDSCI